MRTFLTIILCLTALSGQGQFLKKLGKKAKRAAERTVEWRVERETSKKTDQTLDSILTKRKKGAKEAKMNPKENYSFTSYYLMQLVQEKDTMYMTSYFGEDENVLGSSIEMKPGEQMISVIDLNQNTIHSFMDFGGQKSKTSVGFSPSGLDAATNMQGVSVEPLSRQKEILGYSCEGYEVSGENYHGTVWITDQTDIRYPTGFSELQVKNAQSQGIDHKWMSLIDGLALEMDMTVISKKKPKRVHMLCTELGEADLVIDPSEYKSAF